MKTLWKIIACELECNIWRILAKTQPIQASKSPKHSKRPKTLQTPLPTFPISATTLIIFGFLFINLFRKKYFLILYLPINTTKDIKIKPTTD